jgi:hypothetical protein
MPLDLARRLSAEGLLTDEELAAVVARRAAVGEPVPVALRALRISSASFVSSVFDRLGFTAATRLEPAPMASSLPPGMARSLWVLPIGETGAGVVVAMADPTDHHAIEELEFHLKKPVDPRVASLELLREVLLRIDPPQDPRPQTERAPPPPPPVESSARTPQAGPITTPSRSVRPGGGGLRAPTPAYGEVSPHAGIGRVPSWGTNEGEFALPRAPGRFGTPVGPIGGVDGVAVANATGGGGGGASGGGPGPTPPSSAGRNARDSDVPIPLRRGKSVLPRRIVSTVPRDALYTLAELRLANDRDSISRIVARGLTAVAQRGAFFVVKRGVVQGWEGATIDGVLGAGLAREALRNLWIPVTSQSIFRLASERGGIYVGPLTDSTADSILAAALGGRAREVLLAPVPVRGHNVAFLYADGLRNPRDAVERAIQIVQGTAEALERWLVASRQAR